MKNPYENLSPRSLGNICRTCLQCHDELFMIHEVEWEGIKLLETFELTTLEMHKDDQFPQQMCKRCIKLMYQTYDFLYKCKLSKQAVNRMFERGFKEIPDVDFQTESTIDQNSQTSNPDENNSHTGIGNISEESKNSVDINIEKENVTEKTKEEILYLVVVDDRNVTKKENHNELELRKKQELKTNEGLKNDALFKCFSCGKLFSTVEEMQKHTNETRKKKFKYQCEYCNSKFAYTSQLRNHIRIHTRGKPYQCSTCEKSFTLKRNLDRHVITHMEDKPFKCAYCEKGFSRKYVLASHERTHTGRMLCVYCRIEFESRLALINHQINVHEFSSSAEKSFLCEVCGKILHSEHTLQEHMTLHGPRNFQ